MNEGGTAPITASHLKASDADTVLDELVVNLISPPQFGYIENILPSPGFERSNTGVSIGESDHCASLWKQMKQFFFTYCLCSFSTASFLYKNIIEGHINYVQSRHQKMEPTADQFLLCVSDGKHSSAHVPFYIIINPTNDESPEFVAHNITVSCYDVDLTPEGYHNSETFCSDFVLIAYVDINWLGSLCQEVQEGKMKKLDLSVLRAVDLDVPKNVLLFTIVHPPQHGSILHRVDGKFTKRQEADLQSSVLDFTMADLTNGNLYSILKELK